VPRRRPAGVVAAHNGYFFFGARWLSAEPAAVFDALLVRPSRSTFDAAFAAFALVFRPFGVGTISPPSVLNSLRAHRPF